MEEIEFKSNSDKSRKEKSLLDNKKEKKLTKVVSGKVNPKPKKMMDRFLGTIMPGDRDSVKSYLYEDVLIPAIKKLVSDIITNGVDLILYPDGGGSTRKSRSRFSFTSPYEDIFDRNRSRGSMSAQKSYSRPFEYDDLIYENRNDAEIILESLDSMIEKFGVATIADAYDLSGVTTRNYTLGNYGWTDLSRAKIMRIRDGYIIKFPQAMPID